MALPIPQANLDTDQIIPARFLRKVRGEGYGDYLFHDLRFTASGKPRPEFLLNQPAYHPARIIVAANNFACGSSRENAVWALYDYGFRVAIAPSFGDIFAINALKNGFLTITLAPEIVARTMQKLLDQPGAHVAVDLETATLKLPDGEVQSSQVDPFARHCLLNGIDELEYALGRLDEIAAFERRYEQSAY